MHDNAGISSLGTTFFLFMDPVCGSRIQREQDGCSVAAVRNRFAACWRKVKWLSVCEWWDGGSVARLEGGKRGGRLGR